MVTLDSDSAHSVFEVEFSLRDSTVPFVNVSKAEACMLDLVEVVPRRDGRYAKFFRVRGASVDDVTARAGRYDSVDATVVKAHDAGGIVEFTVSEDTPSVTLAEHGVLPTEVSSDKGHARIRAEIPPRCESSTIIERFLDDYPTADLVSKTEVDAMSPLVFDVSHRRTFHTHLTDRQQEVLRTAYEAGYYDWPRECTGKEVARELGVSSAAFSEIIRAAERNTFSALLDESERTNDDTR